MKTYKFGDTEYLLMLRAIIIHAAGIALTLFCYKMGWVEKVISTDTLYISRAIMVLGVFTLVMGTAKLWDFTRELNVAIGATKAGSRGEKHKIMEYLEGSNSRTEEFVNIASDAGNNRDYVVRAYMQKLERKASSLDHFLEILPMLGLFGTVAGMLLVFGAIDPSLIDKSAHLAIPGFKVALITTAVGIYFTVWFIFVKNLISDGVGQLSEKLLALDIGGGNE